MADRRAAVAAVATRLFGSAVSPDRVIGETLVRATQDQEPTDVDLADAVLRIAAAGPPDGFARLRLDPLAWWIESTFGLAVDPDTGDLVRSVPTTVPAAAKELADRLGVAES